jgi:hypothetical protein
VEGVAKFATKSCRVASPDAIGRNAWHPKISR